MKLRFFLAIAMTIFSVDSFAQKVSVEGFAGDSAMIRSGNSFAMIVRNDTLNKFHARPQRRLDLLMKPSEFDVAYTEFRKHQAELAKLTTDTNWIVRAQGNGKFRITADLKDTLYITAMGRTSQKHAVRDLVARPAVAIQLAFVKCPEHVPCKETRPQNFLAFVGEKISVINYDEPDNCLISMDSRYEATYKILRLLEGSYQLDTIRFTVYDHYGEPNFARFTHALLFVSEYCGKLYHEKYQFFEVYPTANGRWASPGDPYRYDQNVKDRRIQAKTIAFSKTVSFDIEDRNTQILDRFYPSPYYVRKNGRARPVIGAYTEELLQLKKETALRSAHNF